MTGFESKIEFAHGSLRALTIAQKNDDVTISLTHRTDTSFGKQQANVSQLLIAAFSRRFLPSGIYVDYVRIVVA